MTDSGEIFRESGITVRRRLARASQRARANTQKWFKTIGLPAPLIDIKYPQSSPFPGEVVLRRIGDRIEVDYATVLPSHNNDIFCHRIPALIYLMTQCPPEVNQMTVNLGDGHEADRASFAFSSNRSDVHLIPDFYFIDRFGFTAIRAVAEHNQQPWSERAQKIFWRGTDTGQGNRIFTDDRLFDPAVLPRLRLCRLTSSKNDIDCRFTSALRREDAALYDHFGLMAPQRLETDWLGDRYAIDIDGNTNTWSNLIARLHLGCCVLKVESQSGYRQWYYDRLIVGEHYVPVRSDMSDLFEKIAWVRDNPDAAEAIAQAGQEFARSMTLESETKRAVAIITQAVGANKQKAS